LTRCGKQIRIELDSAELAFGFHSEQARRGNDVVGAVASLANGEPASTKAIAAKLGLRKTAAMQRLNEAEKKGLIRNMGRRLGWMPVGQTPWPEVVAAVSDLSNGNPASTAEVANAVGISEFRALQRLRRASECGLILHDGERNGWMPANVTQ
jgi:DNA-binding Lrp family transcriptional regulator